MTKKKDAPIKEPPKDKIKREEPEHPRPEKLPPDPENPNAPVEEPRDLERPSN